MIVAAGLALVVKKLSDFPTALATVAVMVIADLNFEPLSRQGTFSDPLNSSFFLIMPFIPPHAAYWFALCSAKREILGWCGAYDAATNASTGSGVVFKRGDDECGGYSYTTYMIITFVSLDNKPPAQHYHTIKEISMVNQKAQEAVQKSLDSVTGDKSTGVPGLVFVAVDKNGDEIVANASGKV